MWSFHLHGGIPFRRKVTSVKAYTSKDIKDGVSEGEGDFSTKRELTIYIIGWCEKITNRLCSFDPAN